MSGRASDRGDGRQRRADALFEAALEMPAGERPAFLAEACADDPEVGRVVRSLLEADAEINPPGSDDPPPAVVGEGGGRRLGPYRLLRLLGTGGMGQVYLGISVDDEYERPAAIKLLPIDLETPALLRRFHREREILATLDHPNIAKMYQGGTSEDGRPYFAMEHIDGVRLDDYCDRRRLGITERLRLFRQLCSAVAYAHRNLVVHRDLKPSNVLVAADGTPKLLDFGIAKLLDPRFSRGLPLTRTGSRPLTPDYASPEQIRGAPITTASDVYSLGVLLYEQLTGYLPSRSQTFEELRLHPASRGEAPLKPSVAVGRAERRLVDGTHVELDPEVVSACRGTDPARLRRRLAGDLDNIVLMALRNEPERRYASAEHLSEDIRRHLEGLPVAARRPTLSYRAGKLIKRRKKETVFAVLLSGIVAGFAADREAQRRQLIRQRNMARQLADFTMELFRVSDPSESSGETIRARDLLDRGAAEIDALEDPALRAAQKRVVGSAYLSLGLYAEALPQLEGSLELHRQIGSSAAEIAEGLDHLAALHAISGDHARARRLAEECLGLRLEIHGDDHIAVADSLMDIGEAHRALGDLAAAEPLLRRALDMMKSRLRGEDQIMLGPHLSNLASLLRAQGKYDQAEALYRQALAIYRDNGKGQHPDVAILINNLGLLMKTKGDLDEAEALYREALERDYRLFGEEHPQIARHKNNLAIVLRLQGDHAAAEALHREALELDHRLFGEEHPQIARHKSNLGIVLRLQGNHAAAEALFEEAVAMTRKLQGAHHGSLIPTLWHWALSLRERGEPEQAEARFREAIEVARTTLGDTHPRLAALTHDLALTLEDQGKPRLAGSLFRQSLEIQTRAAGEGHLSLTRYQLSLARCLLTVGEVTEAEQLARAALRIRESELERADPRTAEAEALLEGVLGRRPERGQAP